MSCSLLPLTPFHTWYYYTRYHCVEYPQFRTSVLRCALSNIHSANFKRVPCPSAISDRTGCVRNDDKELEAVLAGNVTASSGAAGTGVGRGWVLGVVGVLGLLGL